MPSWALWPGCVVLLLLRALMAAAESALSGVSELKAKELATQHGRAGRRVLRLRTQREMTASSIRIGMVLSGFLAAGVGALAPPAMVPGTPVCNRSPLQPGRPAVMSLLFRTQGGFR